MIISGGSKDGRENPPLSSMILPINKPPFSLVGGLEHGFYFSIYWE